jgi:hypothetical protein
VSLHRLCGATQWRAGCSVPFMAKTKTELKTVVGFFSSPRQAEQAITNLLLAGFPREQISMLASDARNKETPAVGPIHEVGEDSEAGRDAVIGGIAGLVAGVVASAIPGIGPILAIGPLAAAIGGLGIGAAAGGLIGVLKDHGISEQEAEFYAEGVRRGGALVSIHTIEDDVSRAEKVLKESGAEDIQKLAEEWRKETMAAR